MRFNYRTLFWILLPLLGGVRPLAAQLPLPPERPIRLGRFPALSPDGKRICFSYQGNLWVAPITGGPANRLTANPSFDSNPRWSPDGNWIAFNSDREGGNQIFLIPSYGGPARQVTFHSVETRLNDWYPDGRSLLVTSSRETRHQSIFRLDVETGRMKRLISDECNCLYPAISPDGKWIAYMRGALLDTIRKGYRGAANFDIYTAPMDGSLPPHRLTDSDKNDMWPLWGADSRTVYFTSERVGVATLWKQDRESSRPTMVVSTPPDAIRYPTISRNGNMLAYECDNRICITPTTGGRATAVALLCRTDERGSEVTHAVFNGTGASEYSVSPDGKHLAFVVRGDIFEVSVVRGGEARRLTDNPTRDGEIAWSPDSKTIVYTSNREGEYHLYRVDIATKATRQLTYGRGTDHAPAYSPDGKWIAFRREPKSALYLIRPDGSDEQLAVRGPKIYAFKWSPDSRWLAYQHEDDIRNVDIFVISLNTSVSPVRMGEPINISDYPGFNEMPQWFADGTKLAFRSNRNRNRDVETINETGRYALYTTSFQKEKEKFEEDEFAPKSTDTSPPDNKATPLKVEVKIDPREIERRAKQVVGLEEGIGAYSLSPDGKTIVFVARSMGQSDIWQTSADGGNLQRLTNNGEAPVDFEWAPDSSRFYFLTGGVIHWLARGGGASGTVSFTVRMDIDRLVDYRAVFDEAWQNINDEYYDPKFHGVDWMAIGKKYRALLPDVSIRQDFNYLITEMLGELNSSHMGYNAGAGRAARPTGNIGIWADEDYTGPGLKVAEVLPRSPADMDESRLNPGDYILCVDGQEVQADASYDRAMADTVGRTVTLLVNSRPEKEGARDVRIVPVDMSTWSNLLYEQWIDQRRAIVDKLSGGRVGYLHVRDMGDVARNRFVRDLFSIGQRKEAMIIDIRGNTGGDTHDSLLKILERNQHYFNFAPRTETPFPQPEKAVVKPIVVLVNEASLSDAECFTNGFKELKLGKVVGMPTMGWIIFTSGVTLIDGSFLRLPHIGCFTIEGRDMENWGVPPDVRVENTPADYIAGRDPQLERSVEEALKEHPHEKMEKYPKSYSN